MSPNGYKENETTQNYLRIVEVLMVNKRKMKKKKKKTSVGLYIWAPLTTSTGGSSYSSMPFP